MRGFSRCVNQMLDKVSPRYYILVHTTYVLIRWIDKIVWMGKRWDLTLWAAQEPPVGWLLVSCLPSMAVEPKLEEEEMACLKKQSVHRQNR